MLPGRAADFIVLALLVCLSNRALSPVHAGQSGADPHPRGEWHTLQLPVTAESLAAAAEVGVPALPEDLLFSVIRAVHERPSDVTTGPLAAVATCLQSRDTGVPGAVVPLPLAPRVWTEVVFSGRVEPDQLGQALLADRRAALLYIGLGKMDAETLAWVEENPAVLATWYQRHASVIAAFGRSITVRDGRVLTPGGEGSRASWELLVGHSVSDAPAFLSALLARDRGRLAYFFDALAQADGPHQRFVLGPPGGAAAPERLAATYAVFQHVSPEWDAEVHPFYRLPVSPAAILDDLRVDEDGRLVPAALPTLWHRVFGGSQGHGDPVDPAWLLDTLTTASRKQASSRLEQLAFAQRVFAGAVPEDEVVVAEAVSALATWPAMLVALEGLGVTQPSAFVAGARRAGSISGGPGRSRTVDLPLLQGTLAVVARATRSGAIDGNEGRRLAASLLAIDPEAAAYGASIVEWIGDTLIPALRRAVGADGSATAEAVMLRALAGAGRPRDDKPMITWEGLSHRFDVPAGELARLEALREAQGPPALDDGLVLQRAVDQAVRQAPGEFLSRVRGLVSGLAATIPAGDETRALRQAVDRVSRRLTRESNRAVQANPSEALTRELASLATLVTADVVTSLAYLPWLGDPDGPARLGGHVARRHRFVVAEGLRTDEASPVWSLPREAVASDLGWHVEGALLGLETALARLALRRLDVDRIPNPALDEESRRTLAVEASRADLADVDDIDAAAVKRALDAGRRWALSLESHPASLSDAARTLGLDARREQSVRWAVREGLPGIERRFPLVDLASIGGLDPATTERLGGHVSTRPRLTDLSLRLVEGLATLGLPAALLPSVLSIATQDLIDDAPATDGDVAKSVWQFAHVLSIERIEDYVAALAGNGPLVPVIAPDPGWGRS